ADRAPRVRRRDPPGVRRPVRRVHPAVAVGVRARVPRVGPPGRGARARRRWAGDRLPAVAAPAPPPRGRGRRGARRQPPRPEPDVTVTDQEPSEDRARLEAERDVLLKSLDDLEAEHAAGGIDDESYQTLRDDYTARAAAVIRALRDGVDARPD